MLRPLVLAIRKMRHATKGLEDNIAFILSKQEQGVRDQYEGGVLDAVAVTMFEGAKTNQDVCPTTGVTFASPPKQQHWSSLIPEN